MTTFTAMKRVDCGSLLASQVVPHGPVFRHVQTRCFSNCHAIPTRSASLAQSCNRGSFSQTYEGRNILHVPESGGGAELGRSAENKWLPTRRAVGDAALEHELAQKGRAWRGEEEGEGIRESVADGKEKRADGLLRARLAVFVSGGGSNFRALHTATLNSSIHGDLVLVVSDKPGCKGCEYAQEHDIPVLAFPKGKNAPDGISAVELVDSLRLAGVKYVLLAGYLRLLPVELVQAYPCAVLNIHPALLPAFGGKGFYGSKVHEAVIRSGARYSGATIHFVDEKYDTGPILAQRVVPVLPHDTPSDLAARVLKEEHVLYVEAVAALCENHIVWREDGVPLICKTRNGAEYY